MLHARLLSGDVVAPTELAERIVPLLRRRLERLERSAGDPHLVPSVIGLVVAKYLREPERFNPARGGLVAYLSMEARSDVLNELEARRRRRARELPVADPVELASSSRDSTVEEEALDTVDPFGVAPEIVQGAVRALRDLDHLDRQVPISRSTVHLARAISSRTSSRSPATCASTRMRSPSDSGRRSHSPRWLRLRLRSPGSSGLPQRSGPGSWLLLTTWQPTR